MEYDLTDVDIDSFNVNMLKVECKQRNLPVSGKKSDLKKRLRQYLLKNNSNTQETDLPTQNEEGRLLSDFELFMVEYADFKQHVFSSISDLSQRLMENKNSDELSELRSKNVKLEQENANIKQQLRNKESMIHSLLTKIEEINAEHEIIQTKNDIHPRFNNQYIKHPPNYSNEIIQPMYVQPTHMYPCNQISLRNRYEVLEHQECSEIAVTGNATKSKTTKNNNKVTNQSKARNGFPIDQRPETKSILSFRLYLVVIAMQKLPVEKRAK